jgi:Mg2+-importing ATPase
MGSLAPQALVVFIRTAASPWRRRHGARPAVASVAIAALRLVLPFSPLGAWFGFVQLPVPFFLFWAGATVTCLRLVEVVKRSNLTDALTSWDGETSRACGRGPARLE